LDSIQGEREPAVLNWDRVVHKNVRTADGEPVGNIGAVLGDSLAILYGGHSEFVIPKAHVEGFDGSEVHLDLPFSEMKNYVKKI
jgi:hypothetical protein